MAVADAHANGGGCALRHEERHKQEKERRRDEGARGMHRDAKRAGLILRRCIGNRLAIRIDRHGLETMRGAEHDGGSASSSAHQSGSTQRRQRLHYQRGKPKPERKRFGEVFTE